MAVEQKPHLWRIRDDYAPDRSRVASLQRVLAAAAKAGDESAWALYREAAEELVSMVQALMKRLELPEMPTVSFSGGVFSQEGCLLEPFQKALEGKVQLHKPLLTPIEGAVLLAVEHFTPKKLSQIRDRLIIA